MPPTDPPDRVSVAPLALLMPPLKAYAVPASWPLLVMVPLPLGAKVFRLTDVPAATVSPLVPTSNVPDVLLKVPVPCNSAPLSVWVPVKAMVLAPTASKIPECVDVPDRVRLPLAALTNCPWLLKLLSVRAVPEVLVSLAPVANTAPLVETAEPAAVIELPLAIDTLPRLAVPAFKARLPEIAAPVAKVMVPVDRLMAVPAVEDVSANVVLPLKLLLVDRKFSVPAPLTPYEPLALVRVVMDSDAEPLPVFSTVPVFTSVLVPELVVMVLELDPLKRTAPALSSTAPEFRYTPDPADRLMSSVPSLRRVPPVKFL
ncbi:MAG TPA: hypothetical protein PK347_11965 [Burkholderiaceae bacterium]|nr:hypothetical protein [Burkholderiaceae bacterium]